MDPAHGGTGQALLLFRGYTAVNDTADGVALRRLDLR